MDAPILSVIVPAYNASHKLAPMLASLDALGARRGDIEVVFVDDCSTDGTDLVLREWVATRPWAFLCSTTANSGSPSRPRNIGLKRARGEFVFHLDSDDELLVDGVDAALRLASACASDVVRAPLIRRTGDSSVEMNKLAGWAFDAPRAERIAMIMAHQSSTVCGLIRRSILVEGHVLWPEDLRMGEDTVFLASVLQRAKRIDYSPVPDFIYDTTAVEGLRSATQQYEDRELAQHLQVWERVQTELAASGLDWFALRGQVALQSMLHSMYRYNRGGFAPSLLKQLSEKLRRHRDLVASFRYNTRVAKTRDLLLDADLEALAVDLRPRLLIAGYDLKFIRPAIPALSEHFSIEVDEWTGHDQHDEAQSKALLERADVVHAEWMLGNAVWYSRNIKPGQRLLVRLHRFEIDRDFGNEIDRDRVDGIIAVSVPTLEEMQARFRFDRRSIDLIPNFVDVEGYRQSSDPDRVYRLALVGGVPKRKGFLRALQLLSQLRRLDARYSLTVFGQRLGEVSWILRDEVERAYFDECERFIDANQLRDAVSHGGWVETKEVLGDFGFVLSVSEHESFHVAPAEAFAARNQAVLLRWPGVDFIYPERFIFDQISEMRDHIFAMRDLRAFERAAIEGQAFISRQYGLPAFVQRYVDLVRR